ncbi:uncharacterized protein LOC111382375 [Olea europaea var. sylvestris]|uniref:uncharacterized protein LOC111382375 n=1 Tax=Olea europaea var. sylvestris TaxID=158386 RepID=UPI000C1CCE54|nr:uncharacterized protein LOC111382375 [Olea europaea var. sylvestris]
MRDYLQLPQNSAPSCFIFPLNANNFRFKLGMIPLLPNFHGLESESPYLHLKEFEEVCATFNYQTCPNEIVKLKLFPFSVKDKAKTWLNSLKPRSIGTWQEMQSEFLKKFFPAHKTDALKRQIQNFSQKTNEAYFQYLERFKDLLNTCPHHGFEKWRTISFFYDGLTPEAKQFVETMCNGEFLDKDIDEALKFLDHLAENSQSWQTVKPIENSIRSNLASSSGGKYQLSQDDDLNARIASLSRKVEAMELRKVKEVKPVQNDEICSICETFGHLTHDCPNIPVFKEVLHDQANAMNTFKKPFSSPYSETYNQQRRNHPNFSWRDDNRVHLSQPQGLLKFPSFPPPQSKTLEETLQSFMEGQANINNQTSQAINEIKNTLSSLTSSLRSQEKGKFPAQPQPNPSGQFNVNASSSSESQQENANSITTLRSGKIIDKTIPSKELKSGGTSKQENDVSKSEEKIISEPIVEKYLCTVKRKLNVQQKVFLTENVSSIIQQNTPPKFKDPDCSTISCVIGNNRIKRALLDLGASVNLLPFSVLEQLGLGELKPTTTTLQLVDRSVKVPRGVVEDVLVQTYKFYYPIDFIVLDTHPVLNSNAQIRVILGCRFLATSNALINCRNGILKLSFGNMTVEMNIFNICKQHGDTDDLHEVDLIEQLVNDQFIATSSYDALEFEFNDNSKNSHTISSVQEPKLDLKPFFENFSRLEESVAIHDSKD